MSIERRKIGSFLVNPLWQLEESNYKNHNNDQLPILEIIMNSGYLIALIIAQLNFDSGYTPSIIGVLQGSIGIRCMRNIIQIRSK